MNREEFEEEMREEYKERTGTDIRDQELSELEVWLIEELYYTRKMLDNLTGPYEV
jgi:hypothetical protein